ncbi:MAG TPA: NTP transferase domain-containing protein [Kribbella sp.]|nr:NTP transferase domain-containing protein [Kribbella sp.]
MKKPGTPNAAVAGLVLAAGAGRRMGTPKALIRDAAGIPWVVRTARLLSEAGCSPVVVVVGAAAETVRASLTTEPVEVVEAADWPEGMGASLRTGLIHLRSAAFTPPTPAPPTPAPPPPTGNPPTAADSGSPVAVAVVPVDVPGLTAAAVERLLGRAGQQALVRATYDGAPGHPVVIGREHWGGVIASARGDEGARTYLRAHGAEPVECADVADGADVDTADKLPPGHR